MPLPITGAIAAAGSWRLCQLPPGTSSTSFPISLLSPAPAAGPWDRPGLLGQGRGRRAAPSTCASLRPAPPLSAGHLLSRVGSGRPVRQPSLGAPGVGPAGLGGSDSAGGANDRGRPPLRQAGCSTAGLWPGISWTSKQPSQVPGCCAQGGRGQSASTEKWTWISPQRVGGEDREPQ